MNFIVEIPDAIVNDAFAPDEGDDLTVTAGATAVCDIRDAIMESSLMELEEEQFNVTLEPVIKTTFTNHSKRQWSEEECRVMINAALCKLVNDAGGVITISVSELFEIAPMGTLAMALSDDDKILTVTRIRKDN